MKQIFFFVFFLFINANVIAVEEKKGGGVYLGATRVIFDSNAKFAVFNANNSSEKDTWLIRSWLSPYKALDSQESSEDFVITPPLHRLDPKKSVQLRINKATDKLPNDRESIYHINVLSIPPKPKNAKGSMVQFALNTQIKMFYRPHALNSDKLVVNAYKKLIAKKLEKKLIIENPTPYYITMTNTIVNDTPVGFIDSMIAPFEQVEVEIPDNSGKFSYQVINDFGGKSTVFTVSF